MGAGILLNRKEATSKQLIQLSSVFFIYFHSCRVNRCDTPAWSALSYNVVRRITQWLNDVLRLAVPQPLFTGISRVIVDVFSGDIHHTRRLPRRSQEPSYLMEALQDFCCLQMLLASIKGKRKLLHTHGSKCAVHVIIQVQSHNQY